MMTPEQIAAMRAAREGKLDQLEKLLNDLQGFIIAQAAEIERLKAAGAEWMDARKGSVSPDAVRATFDRLAEAESALVAAFDGAKPSAKSGIPWRDGPPPEEWRDGRQVLVWEVFIGTPIVFSWDAELDSWTNGEISSDESCITHHAAINKPGEPHADT